ncbi:hypothetical protein J2T13_000882 [Paenibacillus sp. DS2015]|uniref:hypothetical protein n=1 Tax=Paenibacillus sp. DS2015 TaxID=3373917 RepID=UPI003D262444
MPQKSGFFDSTSDDIREYPARDFAEYFSRFITSGVFNGGLNLNVTAIGNDANIRISPGCAWINGYVYSVYDSEVVLPVSPATTQDRIDRVILRLDTSTPSRSIKALVLQGLAGSTPTPPALVRSGNIYDLSLAQVRVKANTSIVLPANITDERLNGAVCGLVNSLIRVDTATFQLQWDAFIASVKDQGFATAESFNAHKADYIKHPGIASTSGTATAYTVTLDPVPASIPEFFGITIVPHVENETSPTLNINGKGAVALKDQKGVAYVAGKLLAGKPYTFRKVGTDFLADSGSEGGVKRVQRGGASIAVTLLSVDVTVNELDLSKAILKFDSTSKSAFMDMNKIRGEIIDSKTLRFTRHNIEGDESKNVIIAFEVIEFENVKSLVRGTLSGQSNLYGNIPNPINLSKSFIIASNSVNFFGSDGSTLNNVRATIISPTSFHLVIPNSRQGVVCYQIIEFE